MRKSYYTIQDKKKQGDSENFQNDFIEEKKLEKNLKILGT